MKRYFAIVVFAVMAISLSVPQPSGIRTGDIVVLPYIFLGTTKSNYDRLVKLSTARDETGIKQMLYNGEAFIVSEGTKGRVIGSSVFSLEVRIIDGKYQGYSGWIAKELVRKE